MPLTTPYITLKIQGPSFAATRDRNYAVSGQTDRHTHRQTDKQTHQTSALYIEYDTLKIQDTSFAATRDMYFPPFAFRGSL